MLSMLGRISSHREVSATWVLENRNPEGPIDLLIYQARGMVGAMGFDSYVGGAGCPRSLFEELLQPEIRKGSTWARACLILPHAIYRQIYCIYSL